ncbi:MAG: glycosyl hydrolase [Micrococcales bacterium 73-15]|uniref:glycoside hydrolase family 30 protein n=1 Tax=Salana multivorans TaxID=120377 RepID=UPI000964351B|nr:glycoside hydrolase family 30 beta sandwich domain-containing protein [Salana multivorans]OJX95999.1 MAG: glycosyl hydrolase [Micrococcales bacterium 73-15]
MTHEQTTELAVTARIQEYVSTGPAELFVERAVDTERTPTAGATQVLVDTTDRHQTIDGFGASFTDASAYLVDRVLPEDARERAMTELFCPARGIGLSVVRNPMGSSDYSRTVYSYDDRPEGTTDPELEHFSIDHDLESILPLTRWALELNPRLQVFASPWSAPGWMKTTGSMVGGELLPELYPTYAQYFVRFVQAWAERGVPITAVSPQNEPLYVPEHYPGMGMTALEQIDFVREHLAPAFAAAGLTTKIMGYDHNWDRLDYAFDLLDEAADAFDGIAWHWYDGRAVSQSRVGRDYPDKEIHFFEGSGGSWVPAFEPAFSYLMGNGIDILRHGSRSMILWNLALDENNGPTIPGFGDSTCRGLLRVDQGERTYELTLDYWGLAHFSRFIRPGAVRVGSSEAGPVRSVAARNEDGSVVVVLLNDGDEPVEVETVVDASPGSDPGGRVVSSLGPRAAATLVFPPAAR